MLLTSGFSICSGDNQYSSWIFGWGGAGDNCETLDPTYTLKTEVKNKIDATTGGSADIYLYFDKMNSTSKWRNTYGQANSILNGTETAGTPDPSEGLPFAHFAPTKAPIPAPANAPTSEAPTPAPADPSADATTPTQSDATTPTQSDATTPTQSDPPSPAPSAAYSSYSIPSICVAFMAGMLGAMV